MTIKILEHLWVLFIAVGGWMANKLLEKIQDLDKGKAAADDLDHLRKSLGELDRRVGHIDHSIQLRLVPRLEIKEDLKLIHARINDVSEKLCEVDKNKEDRVKTIRLNKGGNKS